ncbi:SRPBCC domain-containing protein [Micromonospora sp. NPDC049523]|uniref:SRPBCC family protein n=1 Tax=Micromonospora sp. NPDC049523 TaxID=3155921 RepID=UPI0034337845
MPSPTRNWSSPGSSTRPANWSTRPSSIPTRSRSGSARWATRCPANTVDVDARTGGHQRLVMVSDEDPNMTSPIDAKFTEVIENELLVGSEEWDQMPGQSEPVAMYMRLEFHDEGGKTRLVLRQGPFTEEVEAMSREGWNSSFTKLDTLLGS